MGPGKIPKDIGLLTRKEEGRDDYLVYQIWLTEENLTVILTVFLNDFIMNKFVKQLDTMYTM